MEFSGKQVYNENKYPCPPDMFPPGAIHDLPRKLSAFAGYQISAGIISVEIVPYFTRSGGI